MRSHTPVTLTVPTSTHPIPRSLQVVLHDNTLQRPLISPPSLCEFAQRVLYAPQAPFQKIRNLNWVCTTDTESPPQVHPWNCPTCGNKRS